MKYDSNYNKLGINIYIIIYVIFIIASTVIVSLIGKDYHRHQDLLSNCDCVIDGLMAHQ